MSEEVVKTKEEETILYSGRVLYGARRSSKKWKGERREERLDAPSHTDLLILLPQNHAAVTGFTN